MHRGVSVIYIKTGVEKISETPVSVMQYNATSPQTKAFKMITVESTPLMITVNHEGGISCRTVVRLH